MKNPVKDKALDREGLIQMKTHVKDFAELYTTGGTNCKIHLADISYFR